MVTCDVRDNLIVANGRGISAGCDAGDPQKTLSDGDSIIFDGDFFISDGDFFISDGDFFIRPDPGRDSNLQFSL